MTVGSICWSIRTYIEFAMMGCYEGVSKLRKDCELLKNVMQGPMEGTMVFSAHMLRYGIVGSSSQLFMNTLRSSCEGVIDVKSTEESLHEMLCLCMTTCK
jgi:hypothetical protein